MAEALAPKLALARAVGALSRRRGGGGTSAPGKLLLRLAPDAIATLGARLPRGSVLMSATNGKTTTAAMAATILERAGIALVHNSAGANMAGGIATTLLSAARATAGSTASSACSRWTRRGCRGSPQSWNRGRSCSATCSGTSSTATASSRRSPRAGPTPSSE